MDESFERLLAFVRDTRGFDYTAYKRPSLIRRVRKRMEVAGAQTFDEYRARLESDSHEFAELFDTILINVTSFFRDPDAWDVVAEQVIPALIANAEHRPIRVWSAGCSSGEEAYSLAMLLAEALGLDAFRERVKIYATDVDERALTLARHASYRTKQVEGVSERLRERYFVASDDARVLRGEIRRSVIFGRNDLLQDPPISRVDLLVSRNTLMYFAPEAQRRILSNFFFALTRRGFLFLGKAEALQSRTNLFEPFDGRSRIFVKSSGVDVEPRLATLPSTDAAEAQASAGPDALAVAAFEHAPLAEVVIDTSGRVTWINQTARSMFGLKQSDVSRPLQDLELSYRPLDLRSLAEQAATKRRPVSRKEVPWSVSPEEQRYLDVQISPLVARSGEHIGMSISFADVTRHWDVQEELATAQRSLETAYEELQSTVEELETTNEELQSTNEELETTNEELQSTNEELETMNEELQSTNEELETMNDELRERTDEALEANSFLTSILSSIRQAVVVVDDKMRVLTWSEPASELWGLRADEVEGESFLNLDIGLPVGELRSPVRRVLAEGAQDAVAVDCHDRRGRPIRCTVSFAPLRTHRDQVQGVILVMSADHEGAE
jgi:two-component system CheB/CheR fusion protein